MMRKLLSLLVALAMLLTMTACAGAPEAAEKAPETSVSASAYPMTLTDQAGRQVTIAAEPQRLISAYYITTSALMALGLGDRLVGIENDAAKRPIYSLSAPELLELPSVGTVKELDVEGCLALEPDLLILPMKLKDVVPTLEGFGLTVLLVEPENQQLLTEMIRLIAAATQREAQGESLVDFLQTQEDFLTETMAQVEKPRVYLGGNSSFLSTAPSGMYQSDLIRLAGGENVAGEIEDTYWVKIDYEQLLRWDPEYIILASAAGYTVEDVLSDPALASCSAVVNRRVYQIPNQAEAWDSPVPGGILGALWLANVLHPQVLTDADCAQRIGTFYETYYDFAYEINET